MKLLFLAYYFPPVQTTGNVRRYHFYREARKYFEAIHVITTRNRRLMATDDSLQLDVPHLTEVPAWDLRRLTLSRKKKSPTLSSRRKNNPFFRFLRRLTDSFPFNIFLDDGGPLYIWRAYREGCRRVEEEGVTHVFSSFRPYADHLVAWFLKGRYPHLYWIADFRDLHVDPVRRNVLWPASQRRWSRRILRRANLVTTVSEGLKRHLASLVPDIQVLRNGITAEAIFPTPVEKFAKFTLSYTGGLYEGRRDPGVLFRTVRRLLDRKVFMQDQIDLIYAGPDSDIWKERADACGLASLVTDLGRVSRHQALEVQQKSHINLLVTWSTGELRGVLTGKLFEYLRAGSPILALINGPLDDELSEILTTCKSGMAYSTTDQSADARVSRFIQNNFEEWQVGSQPYEPVSKGCLQPFTWEHQMEQLMKEIS